jgi:hypothetical protein
MYIIFGDAVKAMEKTYTVLELDTVCRPPDFVPVTAWCVIDQVPLEEFPVLTQYQELHQQLMSAYKQQHWAVCEQVIESLMGRWNGIVDSFYTTLQQRIQTFKVNPPDKDWAGHLYPTE